MEVVPPNRPRDPGLGRYFARLWKDAMLERVMRFGSPKKSFATALLAMPLGCAAIVGIVASPAPAYAHPDPAHEGAELFATRGCTHCHGPQGTGTEMGPSLRDLRKHLKAEQIEDQIVHGGKAMPAFGDSLDHAEVESLVAFLRSKRWIAAPVHTDTTP